MVSQFEIKALQNFQFPQSHEVSLLIGCLHMLCYGVSLDNGIGQIDSEQRLR